MRYSLVCSAMTTVVVTVGVGGTGRVLAQQPDWWDDVCDECSFRVHELDGVVDFDCDYSADVCDSAEDPCSDIEGRAPAVDIEIVGRTVTATYWNWRIPTNNKEVAFKLTGTGATPNVDPKNVVVEGKVFKCPDGTHCHTDAQCVGHGGTEKCDTVVTEGVVTILKDPVTNTDGDGNWSVEVKAEIKPQPERHVIRFELPAAKGRALDVTESWASSCCRPPPSSPALSPWSLGLIGVTLMAVGTAVFARRRRAVTR